MSEQPSGSASGSATPKAIGSLAKKQSDVTRLGTQKLKFTPTLPARRKKDEVKLEPATSTVQEPLEAAKRGRGRGRGRGSADGPARGRGRGRGGAVPPIEMTASGPFAMGPALAASQSSRLSVSRVADSTPTVPSSTIASAALGENLTRTAAPALGKSKDKGKVKVKEEEELYSDPDEGVEIIDMNNIRDMDWMAPEALREERRRKKVKQRESDAVDLKNAIDLSENEDKEEMEDLMKDFAVKTGLEDADPTLREDRLYFFQFPNYFPRFTKQKTESSSSVAEPPLAEASAKKVSFAPDTKPAATPGSSRPSTAPLEPIKEEPVDGVIGQLEVYRSGAVKIRLTNGTLLEVNAATQPSFLQQAVHLDMTNRHLTVLGEVNKHFVVSPDIDSLLEAMTQKEEAAKDADRLMDAT